MNKLLSLFAFTVLLTACTASPSSGGNASSSSSISSASSNISSSNSSQNVTFTETSVALNGSQEINISQFADEIEVAEDTVFGSSDRITGAALSPNGTWIAISVGGAAHDFGWLYNTSTKALRPVVFQYGGGVELKHWSADSTKVTFLVTTPEPKTIETVIDVNAVPTYPRVAN